MHKESENDWEKIRSLKIEEIKIFIRLFVSESEWRLRKNEPITKLYYPKKWEKIILFTIILFTDWVLGKFFNCGLKTTEPFHLCIV